MYRDAEDAATIPEGNDLKVSAGARVTFFKFVLKVICLYPVF